MQPFKSKGDVIQKFLLDHVPGEAPELSQAIQWIVALRQQGADPLPLFQDKCRDDRHLAQWLIGTMATSY